MKKLLFLTHLLAFVACSEQKTVTVPTQTAQESSPKASVTKPDIKSCLCVQLWMPVCGEDGKTYSNSCFADCAGVKYKAGSCTKKITD